MEIDEAWSTGRRYLNMDEYWAWKRAVQEGQAEPLSDAAGRAA
jgi:hypothetical protein